MTQYPTDETGTVVYLFGEPRTPHSEGPPESLDMAPMKSLAEYAYYLQQASFITGLEYQVLIRSIAPLIRLFPTLTTIEQVRSSIRQHEGIQVVQREEEDLWDGKSLIPGFALDSALNLFYVIKEEDPNKTLRGITPEIDKELNGTRYIPPVLNKAYIFFWHILRMCRLQYAINTPIEEVESEEEPETVEATQVIADQFLQGKVSANEAVAATKEELPPIETPATEELIREAVRFNVEDDEAAPLPTAEVSLRTTKQPNLISRAWAGLIDRLSGHRKWRNIAIETRLD